jgi:hypothetical protein
VAPITLPSPASLSSGNEVPHIFTRKSRVQPKEILITSAKRLLQQNRSVSNVLTRVSQRLASDGPKILASSPAACVARRRFLRQSALRLRLVVKGVPEIESSHYVRVSMTPWAASVPLAASARMRPNLRLTCGRIDTGWARGHRLKAQTMLTVLT